MIKHKYKWYYTISIPFQCAPFYFLMRTMLMFGIRLLPIMQAFATASFIDGVLEVLQKKGRWTDLVFSVMMMALVIIFNHLASVFSGLLNQCIGNGVRLKYIEYLITKSASLLYTYIEDKETWDLISRVKRKPDETIQKGLESVLNIAGIFVQAISLLVVLSLKIWWSVFAILFVAVIVITLALKGGKAQYDVQRETAKYVRRYEYIGDVMTGKDATEERNLFGFFDFFQKQWDMYYQKARGEERKITVQWLIRMKLVSSSMALITFSIAVIMLFSVGHGTITIGFYFSMIQAANSLVDVMSWELSDSVNSYARYIEYIKDVVAFANLQEVPGVLGMPQQNVPTIEKIEFKNVSFTYPGVERKILNHIYLTIEAGKHYAVVGKNGAGKTTLIKLLTGLYPDFEGDILINGRSIREIPCAELKAMLTVLFQDFACYEISVEDLIGLGDINELGTEGQVKRIKEVVKAFGLKKKIEELPNNYKTILGKIDLEGQGISGGEWQRIALARTVLSPASLLILDEPTAAMDPLSESALYEQFQKAGDGRTTIFLSHRLGSIMLADEIIVLEQGEIIKQGRHDLLMEQCPLYKEMYESQRRWYMNET